MEITQEHIIQTIALSTILGAAGLMLGRLLRIPAILFLMIFGLLAGPTFLNLIQPYSLGNLLMPFIEISVAIIIFEAGLALTTVRMNADQYAVRQMLIVVLPFTCILAVVVAHYIAGLPMTQALLFGSLIVVTGPTVIGPLLKSVALKERVDSLFRWESVWADCIGVILAGVVLEGVLSPHGSGFILPGIFFFRIAIGLFIGAVIGFAFGRWLVPWAAKMGDPGLPGIMVLAGAIGVFYISTELAESSGVVAAATAGIVLARQPLRELESIKHFKDQVTTLIVAFLFVLLSAQLDLRTIDVPWLGFILTAAIITFIIRPLLVLIALWKSSLSLPERVYVGFMGPRGIIAAAMASHFAFTLSSPDQTCGDLFLLTFITIFISGGFVSLCGKPLGALLKVALEDNRTGIIIVGYGEFAREFAIRLKQFAEVIIIDSSPVKCSISRMAGLPNMCRNALSDDVYEDLMERGYRRVLVLTPNSALNNLIAEKAQNHLGQSRVYLAVSGMKETEKTIKKDAGNLMAFSCDALNLELADQMILNNEAHLDIVDTDEVGENKVAIPLAYLMPKGGVRIARGTDKPKGKAICFIFEKSISINK